MQPNTKKPIFLTISSFLLTICFSNCEMSKKPPMIAYSAVFAALSSRGSLPTATTAPSTLAYTGSPFTFTQNVAITTLTPK